LIQQGQKDAAIIFSCLVKERRSVLSVSTYRAPRFKIAGARGSEETIAAANPNLFRVYNHMPVGAIYYGTVISRSVNDKPRLRIFSNQERVELAKEAIYRPQPFWGGDSKFNGFQYPAGEDAPVQVDGSAELQLKGRCNWQFARSQARERAAAISRIRRRCIRRLSQSETYPAFPRW